MPTFTIISCASAITRLGATPVLVDCDAKTWNMNPSAIEARVTSKTKAIMVVHLYGLPVDMQPVLEIAKRHNLKILEDAAEMIGQTYRGRRCGSFGDLSTFSFYPNKHITTGEGGMVVTDDDALAERLRGLRNLCFPAGTPVRARRARVEFSDDGIFRRQLGSRSSERLEEFVSRKRASFGRYMDLLGDVKGIQLPVAGTDYADNINWCSASC
jgi:perosamine synthetase